MVFGIFQVNLHKLTEKLRKITLIYVNYGKESENQDGHFVANDIFFTFFNLCKKRLKKCRKKLYFF